MPYRRKGSAVWYIRVKGVRQSSGTQVYEDAKALEARLNHEAWLQDRMGVKRPRSWKEAVVRWCKEKEGKASIETDMLRFKWLDQFLGGCGDIGKITRDYVDGIILSRPGVSAAVATAKNSTANRIVALVSGVLNAAEKEWEWGNRAPVLKRYPEPESNGRCLSVEEWWSLWKELPKHLQLAAMFSISTGLREAKVFQLRWQDLSQERSLSFAGTANKIGNSIPLNVTSWQVLTECKSLPVVSPEWVFLYQGKPMQEHGQASFRKAVERAGIGHVRWKDFRTTFNSWLAQRGVPREIRMRLMGHKTSEVQDRYTRLYVEHLRPFSGIIDTILSQPTGDSVAQADAK